MDFQPTHHVTPADSDRLYAIVKNLPPGAVLKLAAGVYPAFLWIDRSIAIVGDGEVVLDAGGERPVITVSAADVRVTLQSLTLRNGRGGEGQAGGLYVFDATLVDVRDVTIADCKAQAGGGALIRGGKASFQRCRLRGNEGELAQALFVYQAAHAELRDCVVIDNGGPGPALTASWGATLTLEHTTVRTGGTAALRLVSTGMAAPTVEARHCILGDPPLEILRGGAPQPTARLTHNWLSRAPAGDGLQADDNRVAPVQLDGDGRPDPAYAGYGARI